MNKYEIQQDEANNHRVILVGTDGTRHAVDNPPCRTKAEARAYISEIRAIERENDADGRAEAMAS